MKRLFSLLPIIGVAGTLCLYFWAASLYPGGTRFDHNSIGYSHFRNFWCDLTDAITYSGQYNPGRPYALAGTVLLPTLLIPFWLSIPILFSSSDKNRSVVKYAGSLAMVLAAFMPIAHNLIINLSSVLVVIAFVGAVIGLIKAKRYFLILTTVLAISFCAVNYAMWVTQYRLDLMPIVQKLAFLSSLSCVVIISLASYRKRYSSQISRS